MDNIKPGFIRISSVLAQWDRFGHIQEEVLQAKANLGTRVHKMIEDYENGVYLPWGDKEEGYFESFLQWKQATGVSIIYGEKRLYCDKLNITGCIDALVRFPGTDGLVLVDFKTSSQESSKIWPLQGCFYHYLATQAGYYPLGRMLFVKLDPNGKAPKVYEYQYSLESFGVCLAALTTYKYLNSSCS